MRAFGPDTVVFFGDNCIHEFACAVTTAFDWRHTNWLSFSRPR